MPVETADHSATLRSDKEPTFTRLRTLKVWQLTSKNGFAEQLNTSSVRLGTSCITMKLNARGLLLCIEFNPSARRIALLQNIERFLPLGVVFEENNQRLYTDVIACGKQVCISFVDVVFQQGEYCDIVVLGDCFLTEEHPTSLGQ